MSDEAGNAEYARWDAGNIRGLGKRRRFVRIEKDADGNDVKVYEVDDEEWNTYPQQER